MVRSSCGKDVNAEKSKVCEWVKLPAPSTTHMHPSLLGDRELPDTAGPYDCGSGVAEGCGEDCGEDCGDAEAGVEVEESQPPKAAWQPVAQYVSVFPVIRQRMFVAGGAQRDHYHTIRQLNSNVLHIGRLGYKYRRCYRRRYCLESRCA